MSPKKSLRPVKWAHLREIDYRTKVGTSAWRKKHTAPQRKLSAYRYLHKLADGHGPVRAQARARGKDPSSSMTTRQMIAASKSLKQRK